MTQIAQLAELNAAERDLLNQTSQLRALAQQPPPVVAELGARRYGLVRSGAGELRLDR